jgi:hypothetical protein
VHLDVPALRTPADGTTRADLGLLEGGHHVLAEDVGPLRREGALEPDDPVGDEGVDQLGAAGVVEGLDGPARLESGHCASWGSV